MSAFDNFSSAISPLTIFQKNTKFLIPEDEHYNPLTLTDPNYLFVGPVFYKRLEARNFQWEEQIKKRIGTKKVIYVTFGGTGFGTTLFSKLLRLLIKSGFFVIASGGTVIDGRKIDTSSRDLLFQQFLPGMSASYLADVVVSHGSYGTIMQALYSERPIICIPFSFEQFLHATRVVESGIGLSTTKWQLNNYLSVNSRHFQAKAESLDPQVIVNMVKEILSNPKYKKNATLFKQELQSENGAVLAARIIEKEVEEPRFPSL